MPKIAQLVSMNPAPENGANKSASIIVFDEVYTMLDLYTAPGNQRRHFDDWAVASKSPLEGNWLLVL